MLCLCPVPVSHPNAVVVPVSPPNAAVVPVSYPNAAVVPVSHPMQLLCQLSTLMLPLCLCATAVSTPGTPAPQRTFAVVSPAAAAADRLMSGLHNIHRIPGAPPSSCRRIRRCGRWCHYPLISRTCLLKRQRIKFCSVQNFY